METKKPGGRPSAYSAALADAICDQLSEGSSILAICKPAEMPSASTVYRWLEARPQFRDRYARARETQCEVLAAQIIDIADTPQMGHKTKTTEKGVEVTTGDMVDRSRLQVDARKWYLAKVAPKKYGDKLELSGDDKAPIAVRVEFVRPPVEAPAQ